MSDHLVIDMTFDAASTRGSTQDVSVCRRRWHTFNYDGFITELQQSRLVLDPPEDVIQLVECYDTTLTTLLDRFAPARPVRLKVRPSAPWYDAECRKSKALTRKLEKAYRRKPSDRSRSTWRAQFQRE